MQEVRRFPCVPCFIFPKTSWNVSNRSFPVLTVLSVLDDRRVVSDIIYVIKHGLQWKDVPDEYRPHRSLYNRLVRWSKRGVFKKISISCQIKRLSMAPWCSTPPTLRLTARRQVYSKRGFSTSHLPNKRRPKFQTSCRLWRAWAARPVFAGWRTVQRLQRCSHSPAPPSRSPYVSGRRRLWRELAVGISES